MSELPYFYLIRNGHFWDSGPCSHLGLLDIVSTSICATKHFQDTPSSFSQTFFHSGQEHIDLTSLRSTTYVEIINISPVNNHQPHISVKGLSTYDKYPSGRACRPQSTTVTVTFSWPFGNCWSPNTHPDCHLAAVGCQLPIRMVLERSYLLYEAIHLSLKQ